MGRPKIGLSLPDGSLLGERVHRALVSVCRTLVLVGSAENIPSSLNHIPVVPDLRKGCGPLGGWEALLGSGLDSEYLVVPCDLPLLSPELLRLLTRGKGAPAVAFRRCGSDRVEPMPVRLPATAWDRVKKALDAGRFKTRDLLESLAPTEILVSAEMDPALCNVNRPEDLAGLPLGRDGLS